MSEIDEFQCIWCLAYGLPESGSVFIIVQENFLLSNPSFLVFMLCLECINVPVVLSARSCPLEVEFNGISPSSNIAENACRYTVMKYGIYFYVALRQSGLHQFQSVILEDCLSVTTLISPLRSRGNFMYRAFFIST